MITQPRPEPTTVTCTCCDKEIVAHLSDYTLQRRVLHPTERKVELEWVPICFTCKQIHIPQDVA